MLGKAPNSCHLATKVLAQWKIDRCQKINLLKSTFFGDDLACLNFLLFFVELSVFTYWTVLYSCSFLFSLLFLFYLLVTVKYVTVVRVAESTITIY